MLSLSFQTLFTYCGGVAVAIYICVIIGMIIYKSWLWVDDRVDESPNIDNFVGTLIGGACFSLGTTLAISIAIKFYVVTLFIIGIILLAHLTRFTRRVSKKLNTHVEDDDVHKKD